MNKNFSSTQNKISAGFTLIELLIVVAIAGIMMAMITASFNNQNTGKSLETNTREFVGVLREAQNYALTGKQFDSSNTACAYRVIWTVSSYTLQARIKSGDSCTGIFSDVASYSLKQGVTFSVSNNTGISFSLPWGTLNGTMSVQLNKSGSSHFVCLTSAGKIVDQGAGC